MGGLAITLEGPKAPGPVGHLQPADGVAVAWARGYADEDTVTIYIKMVKAPKEVLDRVG